MVSLKASKFVLVAGTTCGLLAAAVNVSSLIVARQDELKAASHCEACTAATRVELEFARLEQRIAAAIVPASAVGIEDVQLRLDLLAEHVAALDAPGVRAFTAQDPVAAETVRRLAAAMGQLGPMVDRVDQPAVGEGALAVMAPLDFELSRLAAAADRFGEARADAGEAELARLYRVFTAVLVGLFAFGGTLMTLLAWHNRQLGIARDGLHRTTDDLRAASARLADAHAEVSAINIQLQHRNAILDRRDREMGLQNKRFDAALNNMSMALCMVDASERLVVFNRPFADLFGLDVAPVPGILFADLVALATGPQLKQVEARQRALTKGGRETAAFIEEIAPEGPPASDGSIADPEGRRTVAVSHRPMRDGGWVATYDDISERRQAESRIAYLAHHDGLTGLVNRAFFAEQLDALLADPARRGGRVAVHCLDVDGFQEINDGFGHRVGDSLLQEMGRRILACAGDAVVARLGGDEFALVQTGIGGLEEVDLLAARLGHAVSAPFVVEGADLVVSASLGHAVFPADGGSADALIKNADLALASAKLAGGGTARGFVSDMDAARRARRTLEGDLRRALPNGEFELFFQPLVDARRVAVTGFEALLRWRHPTRGLVSPSVFIAAAEEIGLIADIGAWVIGEACACAARWPGLQTVAVNLSPAQFGLMDLVACVDDALARSGLEAARLELEITETVLLGDDDGALDILHALRARGIRIAMDDFGTGYSSLSYLRRFPFDKIKIDQSFVREMTNRPDCITIVRSIASLGRSLGMTTTAEGVETAEQFAQLQAAGCDQVQGYHFGQPQPADRMRFALGPEGTSHASAA